MHNIVYKNRIIGHNRTEIVAARDVVGDKRSTHAGGRQDGLKINVLDSCMRVAAHTDRNVQEVAWLRQVVGIRRLPGHMQMRAVVWQRFADGALDACNAGLSLYVHSRKP